MIAETTISYSLYNTSSYVDTDNTDMRVQFIGIVRRSSLFSFQKSEKMSFRRGIIFCVMLLWPERRARRAVAGHVTAQQQHLSLLERAASLLERH